MDVPVTGVTCKVFVFQLNTALSEILKKESRPTEDDFAV